jgi:hypothetical protein
MPVPVKQSARKLFGMLHRPGQAQVTVEEMNASIAEGRQEDDRRVRADRRER